MHGDALDTFKNISRLKNLGEIFAVLVRNYVKLQSMATTKHNFERLVFNPAKQKLFIFVDEFQLTAQDAFGITARVIIEQFIYAQMP